MIRFLFLFLTVPALALAAPAKEKKLPKQKPAPKRVATKVSSGKQICQMIEKIAAKGLAKQENIDVVLGKNDTAQGKVGAIGKEIGTFTLGNLFLRAYATGKQGQRIKDGCLKIEFPDLDNDGVKDLELSATIESLDPKAEAPTVVGSSEYHRTFLFHPDVKAFIPMDGSAHGFVELVIK